MVSEVFPPVLMPDPDGTPTCTPDADKLNFDCRGIRSRRTVILAYVRIWPHWFVG